MTALPTGLPHLRPAPELVYATERVELWHGDARDVLASRAKESVDLVLTDPPYGVDFQSGQRSVAFSKIAHDGAHQSDRDVVITILEECVRLAGQNRHLYVFGPEVLRAHDMKVSAPAELVWVKQDGPGMGDLNQIWSSQAEKVNFYTNLHRHAGKRGSENNPVRLRRGNVLRFTKPTGTKVRHPTEKPVPLLREFIESSSRFGDLVLDPFAGTGSTGVAAILMGRRALLCELEANYIDISIERLRQAELLADQMEAA